MSSGEEFYVPKQRAFIAANGYLKNGGQMGPGLLGSWAYILSASMRWDGSGAVDGVWAGLWGP